MKNLHEIQASRDVMWQYTWSEPWKGRKAPQDGNCAAEQTGTPVQCDVKKLHTGLTLCTWALAPLSTPMKQGRGREKGRAGTPPS